MFVPLLSVCLTALHLVQHRGERGYNIGHGHHDLERGFLLISLNLFVDIPKGSVTHVYI